MKPLSARPLFGVPRAPPCDELRFDHTSRGAEIGSVGHDRLELSANGWDLEGEASGGESQGASYKGS